MNAPDELDDLELTILLQAVAMIPAKIDWHSIPVDAIGCVLLCDDRPEATTLMLEAIAGQHGQVVASGSTDDTASGRPLIGCLIEPADRSPKNTADALRANYAVATSEEEKEEGDDAGPF